MLGIRLNGLCLWISRRSTQEYLYACVGLRGIRRQSPLRLIPSTLPEWARVTTVHEVKDLTSFVDILRMRGRTFARTDAGGASKSRD